jgi:hypothetical protein
MANCNHHDHGNDNDNDNSAVESLRLNTGRVVTIFTQSGGLSGSGFTGLLVSANRDFIKLISNLPSAPRFPFRNVRNRSCCGRDRDDFVGSDFDFNRHGCNVFGTVVVIPVNKIVSFVFNEI